MPTMYDYRLIILDCDGMPGDQLAAFGKEAAALGAGGLVLDCVCSYGEETIGVLKSLGLKVYLKAEGVVTESASGYDGLYITGESQYSPDKLGSICREMKSAKKEALLHTDALGESSADKLERVCQVHRDYGGAVVFLSRTGERDYYIREVPGALYFDLPQDAKHVVVFDLGGANCGLQYNACQMVARWRSWLNVGGSSVRGVAGYLSAAQYCHMHFLNRVNLHGLLALGKNPVKSADEILEEWAGANFSEAGVPLVTDILKKTDIATEKLMYFGGLPLTDRSRLAQRAVLDKIFTFSEEDGQIGLGLREYYRPYCTEKQLADPFLELVFQRLPITEALVAKAAEQFMDAVNMYEHNLREWAAVRAFAESDVFLEVEKRMYDMLVDARIMRAAHETYFRSLAGKDYFALVKYLEDNISSAKTPLVCGRLERVLSCYPLDA